MRTIRASEIGTYLYCQRAWWYQQKGYASENQDELTAGSRLHYQHGRNVLLAGLLRIAGYALLLLALVVLAIHLTMQIF